MNTKFRVKSKQEFQTIIGRKKSVANATFVLYYVPRHEQYGRFGVSVGKKNGIAVYRNKYKRQCRMLLQELVEFDNCKFDGVLIIRHKFTTQSYLENKKDLESLLNKVTIR